MGRAWDQADTVHASPLGHPGQPHEGYANQFVLQIESVKLLNTNPRPGVGKAIKAQRGCHLGLGDRPPGEQRCEAKTDSGASIPNY